MIEVLRKFLAKKVLFIASLKCRFLNAWSCHLKQKALLSTATTLRKITAQTVGTISEIPFDNTWY